MDDAMHGALTMVPTTPAMSRKGGIRSAAMSGKMERSMNPMGRNQQYRPGKTRGKRIFIRVSDQELEEIRSAANERGVSISRYLVEAHEASCDLEAARKACETGPVVEQLKAIRTEIWHIGHNVNQIAHNTNHDMSVSPDDEYSTAKAVMECKRLFEKATGVIKDSTKQINHRPLLE